MLTFYIGEVLEIIKTMAEELQKKCANPEKAANTTTTAIPPQVKNFIELLFCL